MLSDELESKPEVSDYELGLVLRHVYGQHIKLLFNEFTQFAAYILILRVFSVAPSNASMFLSEW